MCLGAWFRLHETEFPGGERDHAQEDVHLVGELPVWGAGGKRQSLQRGLSGRKKAGCGLAWRPFPGLARGDRRGGFGSFRFAAVDDPPLWVTDQEHEVRIIAHPQAGDQLAFDASPVFWRAYPACFAFGVITDILLDVADAQVVDQAPGAETEGSQHDAAQRSRKQGKAEAE